VYSGEEVKLISEARGIENAKVTPKRWAYLSKRHVMFELKERKVLAFTSIELASQFKYVALRDSN
jgi:hypothetical protein